MLLKSLLLGFLIFNNLYANNILLNKKENNLVQEKEKFIQLSDIPKEAYNLQEDLKTIFSLLTKKEITKDIHEAIPAYISSIKKLLQDPIYKKLPQQNIRTIQKEYTELSRYLIQFQKWNKLINADVELYEKKNNDLKEYLKLWNETKHKAVSNKAPKAILKQIDLSILKIKELK